MSAMYVLLITASPQYFPLHDISMLCNTATEASICQTLGVYLVSTYCTLVRTDLLTIIFVLATSKQLLAP